MELGGSLFLTPLKAAKSKFKVASGLMPGEGPFPGLCAAFSLYVLSWHRKNDYGRFFY